MGPTGKIWEASSSVDNNAKIDADFKILFVNFGNGHRDSRSMETPVHLNLISQFQVPDSLQEQALVMLLDPNWDNMGPRVFESKVLTMVSFHPKIGE